MPAKTPLPLDHLRIRRRPMSLYAFFVTILLMCFACLLALIEVYRGALCARARMTHAEVEVRRSQLALQSEYAQTVREQALHEVLDSTNLLWQLLTEVRSFQPELTGLLTNETGRAIARYEDLTRIARHLLKNEFAGVPTVEVVLERLEDARRQQLNLKEASGTAYVPDAAFLSCLSNNLAWAETRHRQVTEIQNLFKMLVRESQVKIPVAELSMKAMLAPPRTPRPTLQEVVTKLEDEEARQTLLAIGTARTQPQQTATNQSGSSQTASVTRSDQANYAQKNWGNATPPPNSSTTVASGSSLTYFQAAGSQTYVPPATPTIAYGWYIPSVPNSSRSAVAYLPYVRR